MPILLSRCTRVLAAVAALTIGLAGQASAQTANPATSAAPAPAPAPAPARFTLPALPYASDALEPAIDRQTMELHHGRHHGAAVAALNAWAAQSADNAEIAKAPLEALLAGVSKLPATVRNNGGSHYNHSLFWAVMAPKDKTGSPSAELMQRIQTDFGSLDAMKKQFSQAAAGRFGSGWAWLIVRADKTLAISSTPNQDNPLMDVVEPRGTPILGLDVWEHAYYLKYQNRRGDYIGAWWDVVNWAEVSRRWAEAQR